MNNGKFACGGRWRDPDLAVCAHRTIPCGTWLYVENAKTGSAAWCKVLDRGPYGKLDKDGKWFNAATDRKRAEKNKKPRRKGRYRGVLDMSRSVARRVRIRGRGNIKLWWWDNNYLDSVLDYLVF